MKNGGVLLTEELGNWVADNNASIDWVFCGDPAALVTSFKRDRNRGSEILEVFQGFEKEVQPAFVAALRVTVFDGILIDTATKSFQQVVEEFRERSGVCHPEAFREPDLRVLGYVAEPRQGPADINVRRVYYVGAELVMTDIREGRVMDRPGYKVLRKIMRPGDKLILVDEKALGTKSAYVAANMAALEAQGMVVAVIRKGFF